MAKEKIEVRVGSKWWVMKDDGTQKLVLYGDVIKVTQRTFHIKKVDGTIEIVSRYYRTIKE
jgi:RNase P/RNase MRP subunit p29